jgi:CubicO group peptidase (beta-lactamase class C family)
MQLHEGFQTKLIRCVSMIIAVVLVASCKVRVVVPEGGSVKTISGAYSCAAGSQCDIDVRDLMFDETFIVEPAEGYYFKSWKKRERGFCGGRVESCHLYTSLFGPYPALVSFLEDDEVFFLEPVFERSIPYDFSEVDALMQRLVDNTPQYDGISYILVDREQGIVHKAAFGSHSLDDLFMIASAGKFPTASLIMAINDDKSVDFDITATIDNYLPWEGVYANVTTEHLISNTSGIGNSSTTPLSPSHPHACMVDPMITLESCTETIYTNLLEPTVAPGTEFALGSSQWQLAGGVAEIVTNSTWNQAFDKYIGKPCGLAVFQYGNMGFDWSIPGVDVNKWTGSADSLIGQDNPVIAGGAISNLEDYAKIILMYLRDGKCGDTRVITPESIASMKKDRSGGLPNGWGYGLGMYLAAPTGFPWHEGYFGSIFWIGDDRGIGGFIAVDDYSRTFLDHPFQTPSVLANSETILSHITAVDKARAAVGK